MRLPIRAIALCLTLTGVLLTTGAPSGARATNLRLLLSSDAGGSGIWPTGPAPRAALAPGVSDAKLTIGRNVNVIGRSDVVEARGSCNVGKQAVQNEHSLAVNPQDPRNMVGGSNDYRLYSRTQKRYDGSGGFYRTTDGGRTWTVGYLPGLVRMNSKAPGPYETTGDPAISAGPNNVFWYANIAFNRDQQRNGVAVSRSTNGGRTWRTTWVIRDTYPRFHDKEWIAADPVDPLKATVTWTLFDWEAGTADIVASRTADGGKTWSEPVKVSTEDLNQGSVPLVDDRGVLHVVYAAGIDRIGHAVSPDGGATFVETQHEEIESARLPGIAFRVPFIAPGFAIDGPNLTVVYTSHNGSDADIMMMRSPNYGLTWLPAVALTGYGRDEFFPWVAARDGKVYVGYLERIGSRMTLRYMAKASPDSGVSWTAPVQVSSKTFDVARANKLRSLCTYFIGDYTAMAIGSDGVAHAMWPDARIGNSPRDPGSGADLDPYTATIKLAD